MRRPNARQHAPQTQSGKDLRHPQVVIEVPTDRVEEISLRLFELGAVGVEERDQTTLERSSAPGVVKLVGAFASAEPARKAVAQLGVDGNASVHEIEEQQWRDVWKQYFRPFSLTDRIKVCPPWNVRHPAAGQHMLVIEPGQAFGTGLHATTRLVARALEKHASEIVGQNILDVGCGTGILAFVALAYGASRVRAIDTDPDAVRAAIGNAKRNRASRRIEVDDIKVSRLHGAYAIVIANIEARTLVGLSCVLQQRVARSGLLVLSGILEEQQHQVLSAFEFMTLEGVSRKDEWVALELRKRP